jgi:PTH1 family peptidyl-tRNA hydrolase
MNEAGSAVGPARGSLKAPLDRLVVLHDEIDLPFGEVRTKLGGGVAGHNGLKSLREGLGGTNFWRVRAGVGRPDSSDPETVSRYVLSRFRESPQEVRELIGRAADDAERLVEQIAAGGTEADEGS